uniref:hypothetical protein n=1 Tax=Nosocomiicoccus ampullae TaxID=489910 RepID=UPI00117E2F35|nr:hypothetical protein [Nosocomiicoccus ampullae]
MLINSISISVGFFGAIFTFIFGLKENHVIEKINNSKKLRIQFKYMNYGIIVSGFSIIVFVLVLFVLETIVLNPIDISCFVNNIFYIILSISFYFYAMFATYLYIISNIFFKKENDHMRTKKNPPIKPKINNIKN